MPAIPFIVAQYEIDNFSDAYNIVITPYGSNNVTRFQYTLNGMAQVTTMDATIPIRILPSIAPPYTIKVNAMNEYGSSGDSNTLTLTAPGKPVIDVSSVEYGIYTVKVICDANGSVITNYSYSLDGENYQNVGPTNPFTIPYTVLYDGTSHTIQVKATNIIGTSIESDIATSPEKPLIAVTYDTQKGWYKINVTSELNGSAITDYAYAMNGGGYYQSMGTTNPIIVPYLNSYTLGNSISFSVKASNSLGTSIASDVSPSVVALATVPDKPVIDVIYTGDFFSGAKYLINVTGSPNGAIITNYAYSMDGGSYQTLGASNPIAISYAIDGTSHTFAVKAINGAGASPPSDVSPVVPGPNQPVIYVTYELVSDTINSLGRYSINVLSIPNGFVPVNYAYSMDGENYQIVGSTNPITFTYTPDNISHTFSVYAINSEGSVTSVSDLSPVVNAYSYVDNGGHSYTPPPAPPYISKINVFYVKGSYKIIVTAITNSSSSSVKNYAYSMDDGSYQTVGAANPITIPYIGDNKWHSFSVKAISNNGTSNIASTIRPVTATK